MKPETLIKLHERKLLERKNYRLHNFSVIDVDGPFDNLNIKSIVDQLQKIPMEMFSGIEEINIGNFDFLVKAGKESVYNSGKIYVTNNKNEEEIYVAIIHELAHVLESYRARDIFSDNKIKSEFVKKRLRLYQIIESYFEEINLDKNYYVNTKYNKTFDNFLVNEIGYGRLEQIMQGLFVSPYAATSLSEYFARNLEEFFSFSQQRKNNLIKTAPEVYNKIRNILS